MKMIPLRMLSLIRLLSKSVAHAENIFYVGRLACVGFDFFAQAVNYDGNGMLLYKIIFCIPDFLKQQFLCNNLSFVFGQNLQDFFLG